MARDNEEIWLKLGKQYFVLIYITNITYEKNQSMGTTSFFNQSYVGDSQIKQHRHVISFFTGFVRSGVQTDSWESENKQECNVNAM